MMKRVKTRLQSKPCGWELYHRWNCDSTKRIMLNDTMNNNNYTSIGLFLIITGVYLICSPAHFITTPDEKLNLMTTLSLLEGKKGAIPNIMGGFASKRGIDGNEYAQYGLGVPVAYAAWCKIGTLIDPTADTSANQLENVDLSLMPGTPFLQWWMTVFTMMITALTVVIVERIIRRLISQKGVSVAFALLLAFGTYMMPHGRTLFTEPLTSFCLIAALFMLIKHREEPAEIKWTLFAGLFWAYAVMTRLDTLITGPAAAWFILFSKQENQFKFDLKPKAFVSFAAPFVVVFVIILLYNQFRFDAFFSTGYEDQEEKIKFATPILVGLQGFLFTPGRSLFLYSPFLIFFPWGIMKLYHKDAWLAVGIGILCSMYLCVMSMWQNWAGGWDWGPRHIYQITAFLFIMAAVFFDGKSLYDHAAKKAAWIALIAISVFIQFLGLAADSVVVIGEFLQTFTATYPDNMKNVVQMFIQQYPVYLPQFSSTVLHWNEIVRNGADLLMIRFMQDSPLMLFWFLIPIGGAAAGLKLMIKGLQECE